MTHRRDGDVPGYGHCQGCGEFWPCRVAVLRKWCGGRQTDDGLEIDTLEGTMRADYGDWIIRGVKGEFYPCKPDIFDATYEPVSGKEDRSTDA